MAAKLYSPSDVLIVFGPNIITGFAPGTFVSIERNEESFALSVGSDGQGSRAQTNDQSGRVTFTLEQTSESNAVLSAALQLDERSNAGVLPLLIKEDGTASIYAAETAWIVGFPTVEYSNEITQREWVLETDQLQMFLAGN